MSRLKITEYAVKRIKTDLPLLRKLALYFDIKEIAVERMAERGSQKLLNINVINILRKHGLSDDQIFIEE